MRRKTITAREANQRFSKVLREVQEGYEFLVTKRGRAVMRLVPVARDGERVLTPEQEKAHARVMAFLRRGRKLGIGKFDRDEIYNERIDNMKMFRK
jgi:prevent-host-death family protein